MEKISKLATVVAKAARVHKKAKHLKQVRKRAGYSNNPNYFGDWFGDGQIDFSQIINPNDSGDVYMVKMWGGSGYILDVYLVKAQDEYDAMDKVFEWSYENEGANNIVFDYDYLSKDCHEDYESDFYGINEPKPSEKMSYEDFEEEWMQDMVSNSNYDLFAREENFFVGKVPEEYLKGNKESSKKIKLHKKAEWSEDNFQGLWDMSFANRIVFKSILKNMSLEQQNNFSKWMQANKTEDEIRAFNEKYTLDELLSSKRIKLYKKAKLRKKAAAMTKEQILEDIFQNNIEFDDESKEARLTDDKGRLVEIFELSEKEEDLRKQFDKYVEENDLLDDKYYYFEKNEQAKEEDAYLDSYDYLYSLLVNGNISFYRERLENMTGKEIVQYINWADEMGIDKAKLRLDLLK